MTIHYDPNSLLQPQQNQEPDTYNQNYGQNQYGHGISYPVQHDTHPDAYAPGYEQNQYDNSRSLNEGYGSNNQQSYQSPNPDHSTYGPHEQSQYAISQPYPSYNQQQQYNSTPGYEHNTWDNTAYNTQPPSYSYTPSDSYSQQPSHEPLHFTPSAPDNYGTQGPSPQPFPATDPSLPGERGVDMTHYQYPNVGPDHLYQQHSAPDLTHSQQQQHIATDQHQPGGERGILGAVGGAVAGGYAGHKVNHGFLGAIGGAFAGHKLEEHFKDKKKNKKKQDQHGHSHSHGHGHSSSSSSSDDDKKKKKKHHGAAAVAAGGGAAAYAHHQHQKQHHQGHGSSHAGNFSASSEQITIDRDYDLIASCRDVHHKHKLSSISLNDCLGNHHGRFVWQRGGNFRPSARNVKLIQSGDKGTHLEAELGDGRGGWNVNRINLDERITNNNGDLQFLG